MTEKREAKLLPRLAAVAGIGFAVHLLLGGEPGPGERATVPEQQSGEEIDADERDRLVAADPEEAFQRLARSLPRTDREAQRLKVVEVRALVAQGKLDAARGRARDYFERWPDGPDIATLEQLTGAHPTR